MAFKKKKRNRKVYSLLDALFLVYFLEKNKARQEMDDS